MARGRGVWIRGFGAGVEAGVAVTLILFVYRVLTGTPTPAEVVAERMVRLLPYPVFAAILANLQHLAKPLGFALAVAVTLTGFGLGGMLYAWLAPADLRSRALLGLAAALVTWVSLTYAFLPLVQGGILGVPLTTIISAPALPMAVGSLIYGVLLTFLIGAPERGRDGGGRAAQPPITRRALLRRLTPILLAAAAVSLGAWAIRGGARAVDVASRALQAMMGMSPRPGEMPPEVTPTEQFYLVSKNYPFDPTVDVATWRLTVSGLVSRPLTFSHAEFLKAAPPVERFHTLECIANEVGGDLIGNARWRGLRLGDVLDLAGVREEAATVIMRSADNYAESVPLAVAMDPTTLLAFEMNGEPLPPKHGAPVRVLIANRYGMKQPKWLTGIEVVAPEFAGYWQQQGRSKKAIVKTHSAFRVAVQDGAVVRLGGWAFAGTRGISAVEVTSDGGHTWFPAVVRAARGVNVWQFWTAEWTPPGPGEYALRVRAVDGRGVTQPGKRQRLPDGAEGYHEVVIRVTS